MKVGFIGAGRMATTIGRHLIGAGHEVVLSSSRGPEALAGLVADLGPAASAGSKQEAAECDVVILATNWADAPEALKGIDWRGRILVDGTNAHMGEKPDISAAGVARSVAALEGRTSSETVAAMALHGRQAGEVDSAICSMPPWIQDFPPTEAEDRTCSWQETIAMPGARGRRLVDACGKSRLRRRSNLAALSRRRTACAGARKQLGAG